MCIGARGEKATIHPFDEMPIETLKIDGDTKGVVADRAYVKSHPEGSLECGTAYACGNGPSVENNG